MRTLPPVLVLFLAAGCSPNVSQQADPRSPDRTISQAPDLASQDRDFIEKAAQGGTAEITIGALVDDRALRPEVAAFGHMMVTDHSAANRKLTAIADAKHIALPTTLGEHQAGFDRVVALSLEPFDREFMRLMVEEHQDAAQLFRSEASGGVDPALKSFAAATLPTIEAHLNQARALASVASPPQELTSPPTADATQIPPASPVKKLP